MMKKIIYSTVVGLLLAVPAFADSMDDLAARLSNDHTWENGMFPAIALPSDAPTDEVVSKVFERSSFDKVKVTDYKTAKVKKVRISGSLPDQYTAVLVETNLGEKIVLLKYISDTGVWWSRVYDQ